jgi:hypothetical protein
MAIDVAIGVEVRRLSLLRLRLNRLLFNLPFLAVRSLDISVRGSFWISSIVKSGLKGRKTLPSQSFLLVFCLFIESISV